MSEKGSKKKKEVVEESVIVDQDIEEVLTDSEDEEENDGMMGYIEVKKGKGDWKHFYAIILGGSLFLYKDSRVSLASS